MAEKNIRNLKVYEASESRKGNSWYGGGSYKAVPQIRLQGAWLEKIDFKPGSKIKVECQSKKIIIELIDD